MFDLDGTLVDSLQDIVEAMNQVLAEAGLPQHTPDAYRYFIGAGAGALVQRALPPEAREHSREHLARFRAVYEAALVVHSKPYPGVPELLRALVDRGVGLSILSNKPHPMTRGVVETFFADVPFVKVEGAREGIPRKPDPQAALSQAEALGVPVAQILFVGDTGSDMETAVAAGMRPVGVAWGFRGEDELRAAGAEVMLRRPLDLLDLVVGA